MWYLQTIVVWMLAGAVGFSQNLNLATLKKDTQIFEGILSQVLKQNFPHPFALTEEPLASYLQGYGIVIAFHLNINRDTIRTPFGEYPNPRGGSSRTRQEQLRQLKEEMMKCLADYGGALKQLGGQDRITIHARVEDRNELDPLKNRINVIITASKDDIDLYTTRKISLENFLSRVQILEY